MKKQKEFKEGLFERLMKKLHWSVVLIILVSLMILAVLGYMNMTTGKEVPSNIIAVLTSVISGLIGYSAGRGEEDEK